MSAIRPAMQVASAVFGPPVTVDPGEAAWYRARQQRAPGVEARAGLRVYSETR